jgi:hypothetical protein
MSARADAANICTELIATVAHTIALRILTISRALANWVRPEEFALRGFNLLLNPDLEPVFLPLDPLVVRYLRLVGESELMSRLLYALKLGVLVLSSRSPTVKLIRDQLLSTSEEAHNG